MALVGRLVVAAFAGLVTFQMLAAEYDVWHTRRAAAPPLPDTVTAYVARVEPFSPLLPPDAAVHFTLPGLDDERIFWHRYGLAQYALAPTLLDRADDHRLILADFSTAPDSARLRRLAAAETLAVVADPGNGLVLFQKKPRR